VNTASPVQEHLAITRTAVEAALQSLLPAPDTAPSRLHEAMRHPLFAGGKRLRPLLVVSACQACGGQQDQALVAACAVEMIHTYSLVHDDLPAMDDDSLRRGQPTTHVVYGEALAILVGDALLNRAAEVLYGAAIGTGYPPPPPAAAAVLLEAAGSQGMIGGQVLDLDAEGQQISLDQLEDLHRRKTGALIRGSLLAGGHCADTSESRMEALALCGSALGLAFQIVDDILDITGNEEVLGKSAGKDVAADKSTFPALMGLTASRERASQLAEEAEAALKIFGSSADPLRHLVHLATDRLS
jgi:geranylgeranyl diphosphate synthase type II